jgi:hypothetical protein
VATPVEAIRIVAGVELHAPHFDPRTWAAARAVIREYRPHKGVIIGDFLDLESLSSYPRRVPDPVRLSAEWYAGNVALDELQEAAPSCSWTYLEGNHEERARRYAAEHGTLDGLLSVPESLYIQPCAEGYRRRADGDLRGMAWVPIERAHVEEWAAYHHGASTCAKHHAAYHAEVFAPSKARGQDIYFGHLHTDQVFAASSGVRAACCGWLGDEAKVPKESRSRPTGWRTGLRLQEWAGGLLADAFVPITVGRALWRGSVLG